MICVLVNPAKKLQAPCKEGISKQLVNYQLLKHCIPSSSQDSLMVIFLQGPHFIWQLSSTTSGRACERSGMRATLTRQTSHTQPSCTLTIHFILPVRCPSIMQFRNHNSEQKVRYLRSDSPRTGRRLTEHGGWLFTLTRASNFVPHSGHGTKAGGIQPEDESRCSPSSTPSPPPRTQKVQHIDFQAEN
jgi:hypothetical protein